MAKIETYRHIVQELLKKYGSHKPAYGDVEVELIFDNERDRYQVVHTGWYGHRRIYGSIIHIDIQNEKIWIQHNGTETDIADELVALGVPKEDIVLAFQAPYKRQYTALQLANS